MGPGPSVIQWGRPLGQCCTAWRAHPLRQPTHSFGRAPVAHPSDAQVGRREHSSRELEEEDDEDDHEELEEDREDREDIEDIDEGEWRVLVVECEFITHLQPFSGRLEITNQYLHCVLDETNKCTSQNVLNPYTETLIAHLRPTDEKWALATVAEVLPRRYRLQRCALEIMFSDGRTAMFNLVSKQVCACLTPGMEIGGCCSRQTGWVLCCAASALRHVLCCMTCLLVQVRWGMCSDGEFGGSGGNNDAPYSPSVLNRDCLCWCASTI